MKANTSDYETCDVLLTTEQVAAVQNDGPGVPVC